MKTKLSGQYREDRSLLPGKLITLVIFVFFYLNAFAQVPLANFTATPLAGCSPFVVNFQDLSTNSPTVWNWNFGNGATSAQKNPSTTFFNPGTYTVILTATNASGSNTLTRLAYITVYETPTVDFSASQTSGCFPLRAQFTDLSTAGAGNTNVAWQWSFGDGTTSSLQNPLHIYTTSGNQAVTLKVTNDKGCSKVISKVNYIQVSPGIKADFYNSPVQICAPPANITFTNTSYGTGNITYNWLLGDGSTSSSATSFTHTYSTKGSYDVTLIATSDQGCFDTIKKANTVNFGSFNSQIISADSVCLNGLIEFKRYATQTPSSTAWIFDDGTSSTDTSYIKQFTISGPHIVTMINNLGGCADTVNKTIFVTGAQGINFSAPATASCQPPLTVNFQDNTPGNIVSWRWDFGDGTFSNLKNPSHTYTAFGNYGVKLVVTNSMGCIDSATVPGFIKIQRPVIVFNNLPAGGCIPFNITMSATVNTVDTVTSWLWNLGDGNTSSLQNPSHTYPAFGTYPITLTVTTSNGCTETSTLPTGVRVGTPPVADFSATPTTTCVETPVTFIDMSAPADQWFWDFGDGTTSTQKDPVHLYSDPGTFTVTLVARNNGCPDSVIKTNYITIPPPKALFIATSRCGAGTTFDFSDQSTGALSLLWDFGDGSPTTTVANPSHTFPALGTYTVSLTATNGSCQHIFTMVINAVNINPDVVISPNPVCRNQGVGFTAINIDPNIVSGYFWDFGDGVSFGSGSPVSHQYANSGNYNFRLIVTDVNGCKDTVDKNNAVRIYGPVANFSTIVAGGCPGSVTTFNDISTTDGVNNILSWTFDFGDSNSTSIQNFPSPPFTHIYNDTGRYHVKMIVVDAFGCADSIIKNNIVTKTKPIANFSSANVNSCPNGPVTFIDSSIGGGLTHLWNFGDGNSSTLAAPIYAYQAPGLYSVTLTVTDINGCADTIIKSNYISVDTPHAAFTVSDTASSCIPFIATFTNASSYFYATYWIFDDGQVSFENDPTHYYTAPGIYNATLIATSPGGCRDTATIIMHLYDTAGTRIAYNPLIGCNPIDIALTSYTNGPFAYLWDFGDGETADSSTAAIMHTYNSFGTFVPKLILKDPTGCLIPITGPDSIRINGSIAKFRYDHSFFCDSGTVIFSDSTTSNEPVTNYLWNFGDGTTSSLQNPSHFYSGDAYYSVSLSTTTQSGCTNTFTIDSAVKVISSPLIQINGPDEICMLSPASFNGLFLRTDTSQVIWNWNYGDGSSGTGQQPPAHIYASSGDNIISTIVTNSSGCADTATHPIRVHPLPSVILPPELILVVGNSIQIPAVYSGNMNSYAWSPTDKLSCTDCPAPIASTIKTTTYTVNFIDSNGCANTGSVLIKVICENSNTFMPNTFSPNGDGSNDIFYPRGKGLDRVKALRIFNRWGEIVFENLNFKPNDPAAGWNGTYKGKPASADVYVYQVEIYCLNGELIRYDGNVALIK